jgi:hypothetical protein
LLTFKERERVSICMLKGLGGELLNWVTFGSIMAFYLSMVEVDALIVNMYTISHFHKTLVNSYRDTSFS